MTDHPAPLTPADSDISDFGFMPLDVVRFRNSDLVAMEEPDAVLAALLLWGAAWHATPAGSLTDDDRSLAQAAGYGRAVKEWMKVKAGALRGFIKCSDGRLYHPVVAEKVNEAWTQKLEYRERKARRSAAAEKAANARWGNADEDADADAERMRNASDQDAQRMPNAMPKGTGTGTGTGTGNYIDDEDARARALADPFGPIGDLASRLARAAGVALRPNDRRFADQLDIVRDWTTKGLDIDAEIIPALEQAAMDDPANRHSLKYFNPMIARLAAQKAAQANGRTSLNGGHGLGSTVQAGLDFAAEVEARRSHASRAG